jgi:hypothetical protein
MKFSSAVDSPFDALEGLMRVLAEAEDATSRLDERLRSPLGEGLQARMAFQEVCAWAWNRGDLVHVEDLVLHDEGLDARSPDQTLTRVHAVLRLWRRTGRMKPAELLSADRVIGLIGSKQLDPPSGLVAAAMGEPVFGTEDALPSSVGASRVNDSMATPIDALIERIEAIATDDNAAALSAWFEIERDMPKRWPALLRAAVLAEAWAVLGPLPRHGHLGAILVNACLQRAGRLYRHRLCLELGARVIKQRGYRRPVLKSGIHRVIWWLECFRTAEMEGLEQLDRLSLACQVVSRRLVGRRSNSRLAEVVDLFVRCPVVSAGMIAQELKVTQQAARALVVGLGGGVVEVTGRARFKAWRL